MNKYLARQRVAALDGVRGIAILSVLSFHWIFASLPGWHSPDLTPTESFIRHLTMLNWAGVDLFFVLSGFLIGGIILDNRDTPNFFRVFYARRALRILPLYALLLALFALCFILLPWQNSEPLRRIFEKPMPAWVYLAFVQNAYSLMGDFGNFGLGATWSLAIEEQFYLLFPALICALPRRWLPAVLIAGIFTAIGLRTTLWLALPSPLSGDINYALLFCRMDALLVGALAAWVVRDPSWSRLIGARIGLIKAAVVLMPLPLIGFIIERWSAGQMPMTTLGYTWIAALCGTLVLVAYYDPPRILENRVLRSFGLYAYSIYLFHRPIGMLTHWAILGRDESVADVKGMAVTVLCLGLVVLWAALTWRFMERRMIGFGHRFGYGSHDYAAGNAISRSRS